MLDGAARNERDIIPGREGEIILVWDIQGGGKELSVSSNF